MIQNTLLFFLSCFITLLFSFNEPAPSKTIEFSFYTETIKIPYDPEIVINQRVKLEEEYIVQFYKKMERAPYQSVLSELRTAKHQYQLNDWLFYELVEKTVNKVFMGKGTSYKVLATWFLMSKLHYDTRLAFLGNTAYLYVKTLDNIYETPMIEEKGSRYFGLTELQYKRTKRSKAIYLLNFIATPNGKPFSLAFNRLPALQSTIEQKDFSFQWRDKKYKVVAEVDKTLVEIMRKYPIIDESGYIKVPFSDNLKNTLIRQLGAIIKDKPIRLQLEILSSFTRSAFQYKEDEAYFGRSKPMIREEVFHYAYSDCEDRSAVFYGLVDELLHLPMLVIAFSDHLTIAVALKDSIGTPIRHKGKNYYICDPTGPSNSSEIGYPPKGYERKSFEILLD